MRKVAIIDYGRGNVRSVANALEYCGVDAVVTADAAAIDAADRIILPGVGAFGDAMAALQERGLPEILDLQVRRKGKPFLGICLGMQVLAERGHEHGTHAGLGWIPGEVVRFEPGPDALKIPHTGWNTVTPLRDHALLKGFSPAQLTFYFVHSYHFRSAAPDIVAHCHYGQDFAAMVACGNIAAVQFHPEKSQDSGIEFLQNFIAWAP